MSKTSKKAVKLKVKRTLSSLKELFAYVVDKKGKVIEVAPIIKGEAKFKSKPEVLGGETKLFIAGKFEDASSKEITLSMLERVKAYQPVYKMSNEHELSIGVIPDIIKPIFSVCKISGSVKNHFTIDGEDEILPADHIRVNICEVDPWFLIIKKIPDYLIQKLRDDLIDLIEKPIPWPIPDSWPPYYEVPFPKPFPYRAYKKGNPIPELGVKKLMSTEAKKVFHLPKVSDEFKSGLLNNNLMTVRNTLLSNFKIMYPYFCYYPHIFPWHFYHCDHIATVQTDCNGRFEHDYQYVTLGDKPDIYIWVEALIDGNWETVYKPWKPCGIHWNYACGTDINITLHNPDLTPAVCDPMPGEVVWIKKVNSSGINIRNIQQNSAPREHLSNGIGLTSFAASKICPFAKQFPLVVQFGSGYPNATVKHYRWRYRRIKNANLNNVTETYKEYSNTLHKHYTYETINSDGDTVFMTGTFKLGPESSPNGPVYKIPHVDAVDDIPAADIAANPALSTAKWNQNTYSIYINSEGLDDGLYEFIFELLDNSGNVVHVDPDVFVVTKKAGEVSNPPDATTISADNVTENYVLKLGAKATGFRFVMRIDNQVCYPEIKDAIVDGNTTDPICGFAQYNDKSNDKMTLKFYANHPNDFARYHFFAVKGNQPKIAATDVIDHVTQVNNGYSVSNDVYEKELDVSTMLGTCDQAAFAESLFMYATHTNGNRRIHEYDAYDSAGFAIEPA